VSPSSGYPLLCLRWRHSSVGHVQLQCLGMSGPRPSRGGSASSRIRTLGDSTMKIRLLAVVLAFGVTTAFARAQEPAKPGPEHEKFKALVGDWEATVKMGGNESKAKANWKLDFGGFYAIETFEGDFGPMKLKGRGQSGYCPIKQKYFTIWVDSMS